MCQDSALTLSTLSEAIPLTGDISKASTLLSESTLVGRQCPASFWEARLRLDNNLPDDPGVIPIRNSHHVLHQLEVATGRDIGHAGSTIRRRAWFGDGMDSPVVLALNWRHRCSWGWVSDNNERSPK